MSHRLLLLILLALFSGWPLCADAQQTIQTPDGKTITIPEGADPAAVRAAMQAGGRPSRPAPPDGAPGKEPPGSNPKSGAPDGQPGKAASGDAKPPALENVQRSAKPPEPPDPDEFNVQPDQEGLLYFQFRNQPWPEVLRWYAGVCNLSFDWQELPGDYINLATQRPHTLEETGDMINRALLMRGFTMLEDEETLTVAKVDGLNPALVPRVDPNSLSDLPPHKYVRTSFSLVWLLAEEVHTEFAAMISKNGKLTPLQSTNRLEGMDAAANLLDIHRILEQEQSAIAMENLAREFVLEYARAAAVKEQLEAFLGIQSSSSRGDPMSSSAARMMQQQMQMQMQQMQQQMQQAARNNGGGAPATAGRKRPDDVYLVANERSNSLIVHAPPNKMAIIAAFIQRVDVRNESSSDYQRISTRMKVFRLASLSPRELVESLTAMDVLEPTTRLQVDEDNNAIIAYASVADQYMIQSVIERLDGSERRFEVVQLRRLDAESVAGSIKFLMGAEENNNDNDRRNRYLGYYDFGYGGYGSSSNRRQNNDKMRVGSNARDNQLLLWVNDIEMEEVENLLVKLGELPRAGETPSNLRMIDASRQPETFEYLRKLKEQWEKVSPNPLVIPGAEEFAPPQAEPAGDSNQPANEPEDSAPQPVKEDEPVKITTMPAKAEHDSAPAAERLVWTKTGLFSDQEGDAEARLSQTDSPPSDSPVGTEQPTVPTQEQPAAAPIKIFLDEGGNLILQSDDTEALDKLERIMQANKPPKKPYDIFKVKYARASWVALNLEEYFDKNENDQPRFFSFFFDEGNNKSDERQLGDRPPLRFIYDNDTNSIVVQGADDLDRQTIRELIELWDVPEPVDESSIRYTKLIRVKYSRATNIVNTIKEAYRDLLSANDKAFQEQGGEDENKRDGGGGGSRQGGGFSFSGLKGKLSLGPDDLTNSILISCEGEELMELVEEVIRELDEAAKEEGAVEVYRMTGGISGRSLEKSLRAFLNQKQDPNKPPTPPNQNGEAPGQPPAGQPGQPGQAQPAPGGQRAPGISRGGRR